MHVGQNNELFYFTSECGLNSTVNYVCNIIDTEIMTGAQSKLQDNTPRYFSPPVQSKMTIDKKNKCFETLDRLLNPETGYYAKTSCQLYTFKDTKYLVLPLSFKLNENGLATE